MQEASHKERLPSNHVGTRPAFESRRSPDRDSYKPQELTMLEESSQGKLRKDIETPDDGDSIYSDVNSSTLSQIKNIDVDGSFGTKVLLVQQKREIL